MSALGPTATAFLAEDADALAGRRAGPGPSPGGLPGELAASLWGSARVGRRAADGRLAQFGIAQASAKFDLVVRTHLPPLPKKWLSRAPALVVVTHERLVNAHIRQFVGVAARSGANRHPGPGSTTTRPRAAVLRHGHRCPDDAACRHPPVLSSSRRTGTRGRRVTLSLQALSSHLCRCRSAAPADRPVSPACRRAAECCHRTL
jgi:hypothetical protein